MSVDTNNKSKTQTVTALSKQRSIAISEQIKDLRQLQNQSVENLAVQIEPLAQALAALSDEGKKAIIDAANYSTRKHGAAREALEEETGKLRDQIGDLKSITADIATESEKAKRQLQGVTKKVWAAAISTSLLLSLGLLIGYMLWQPPLSSDEKTALRGYHALDQESQRFLLDTGRRAQQ